MSKQRAAGWRHPAVVGLLGVALMVGGWKVSTYEPRTPLTELRDQAEDPVLRERIDRVARQAEPPPLQLPGRLALLAGLVLFVGAGITMFRQRPEAEDVPDESPEPDDEARLETAP